MATTDTRSGFRLPWSSDRSHDAHGADDQMPTSDEPTPTVGDVVDEAVDGAVPEIDDASEEMAPDDAIDLSSSDINARLGLTSSASPADPSGTATAPAAPESATQEPAMIDLRQTPAPVAPRKPSKLMANLSAAIRATAEAARDQALAQVDEDVAAVVEAIRIGAKEGEDALRVRSDDDIAGIKDWSRAEIARIKEETEHRIEARKVGLEDELAAHAAAIEGRVAEVEVTVAAYRSEIDAYADRLVSDDDPSRLATMAESMPEPPELGALADLRDLSASFALDTTPAFVAEAFVVGEAGLPGDEPVVALAEAATPDAEADARTVEDGGTVEAEAALPESVEPETGAHALPVDAEAVALDALDAEAAEPEAPDAVEAVEAGAPPVDEAVDEAAEPEPVEAVEPEPVEDADAVETPAVLPSSQPTVSAWADAETAWGAARTAVAAADLEADLEPGGKAWDDGSEQFTDVPHWSAGATPDGFPTGGAEAGETVDRGAIMAALEAAAEAVVAAEAAAESADQAEAAADVAETAAEILKGRSSSADEEPDPEAQAALSARMGAGGLEESFADRLASLLPGHADGAADGEPRSTQVIVSGLVSVASIASFKRHLSRLSGVQAVAVASGPDGEFVFNVTHRPDVSFRDAVPTMPGFAARVTGTGDGVVHVTARDPEAEG